jgi:hypothetical protein
MSAPKKRTIARVTAREGDPDAAPMSLDQYVAWAEAERQRMMRELQEQLEAEFERAILDPPIH